MWFWVEWGPIIRQEVERVGCHRDGVHNMVINFCVKKKEEKKKKITREWQYIL